MEYIFKEKIKYSQYEEYIKNENYLSYMQEKNWANVKNVREHKIVGVFKDDKLCAVAHVLIINEKRKTKLIIPNGYLLDFKNKELLNFMTNNIKLLAKKYNAYVVDIFPNIFFSNKNRIEIHNNLLELNYKYKDEYIDQTKNFLLPLKSKNKKLTKKDIKNLFLNKDFYLKRGLDFEISNKKEDIDRLEFLINSKYFNKQLVERLLENYPNRVYMIFCKLDLVFYEHFLKNSNEKSNDELSKIQELLTISDNIDIGCALIIKPFNKKKSVCEFIYNEELESFEHLNIQKGLISKALEICIEDKFDYLKISNIKIDTNTLINDFKAEEIKYIGHYSLIMKKITYYLNKPIFYLN